MISTINTTVDNIPSWCYVLAFGLLVSRRVLLQYTRDFTGNIRRCFMTLFHVHKWSGWEKDRDRPWQHYSELVRYCTTCNAEESKLLTIFCPTYHKKGSYCNSCSRFAGELEKRLAKVLIMCDNEFMKTTTKKKGRPFENIANNVAITLEIELNGKSTRTVATEYNYKDHSSIVQIRKRTIPLLNIEKIKQIRGV